MNGQMQDEATTKVAAWPDLLQHWWCPSNPFLEHILSPADSVSRSLSDAAGRQSSAGRNMFM